MRVVKTESEYHGGKVFLILILFLFWLLILVMILFCRAMMAVRIKVEKCSGGLHPDPILKLDVYPEPDPDPK